MIRSARVRGALPCAIAIAALLASPSARAQESAPATPDVPGGPAAVIGRLVHATRPEAVAEARVLLYALSADGGAGLREGRTDADGRFRFEGISNAPEVVYLVGARPGAIPFGTRFSFAAGELEHRVEVAVSDAVSDPRAASVETADVRVDRGCTHLRVSHRHEIRNRGREVIFVPPEQRAGADPILALELPAEVEGFESIAGGEGLVRDGRSVRFWGPLYPGEQVIEFGYGLAMETATFAIGFPRGAPPVQVMAPQALSVSGPGLAPAPEVAIDETRYAVLRGGRVAPGGSLELSVALAPVAAAPLRTPRGELWLELDDAALEVDERLELAVDGDGEPLAPSAAPLLCIPLPPEASGLRFSSEMLGAGLRRDPSGELALHGPLPPGISQIALSYQLPATSRGIELVRRFDRPVSLLSVLVADNGVIAETDRLHRRKSVRTDDRNFLHLEAFAIEPGEAIALALRRTEPRASGGPWASAGFAVLAGLAALAFLTGPLRAGEPEAARRRKERARSDDDASEGDVERHAIVRSLEALDEDLETGKLSPEDHAAMRAELRARAAALLLVEPAPVVRPAAEPGCPACGAAARATDVFCSQCGARLHGDRQSAGSARA